jgi:hypothetical protein
MSCNKTRKDLCRLSKDSYESITLSFAQDVSDDVFTLKIYKGKTVTESITGQSSQVASMWYITFPEFTLTDNDYDYEIYWENFTIPFNEIILFGKYRVTSVPNACGCDNDGTFNFTINQGGEEFPVTLQKTIIGSGSSDWNDIQNKPTEFPPERHTHSWSDITSKPSFFSGDYNDLINKPTIPTHTSQLVNDSEYLVNTDITWTNIIGKPNFATIATSGSYTDLTNKPTLFSGAYADLTGKPTIPAAQVNSDWNAISGVAQILNKPTIPTVPTPSTFTGTVISLSNVMGNYQTATANSATIYTTSGAVLGGWAQVLINAAIQPTVTGATLISGSNFTPNTNMYLMIRNNGVTTEYYFAKI